MPEIKHNFMKGKMNKDLDERLVPNGEYRDAMNVQVATSEGSDVGTAQNILGNELRSLKGILREKAALTGDAIVVGAVSDEKINTMYYLVWSPLADYIFSYNGVNHKLVLIDYKKNVLKFTPNMVVTGINVIDGMLFWTDNINEPRKINIQRCIDGTLLDNQTRLLNTSTGALSEMKEKHITVIKKGPQIAPDIKLHTSRELGKIYTAVIDISSSQDVNHVDNDFPNWGVSWDWNDFSTVSTEEGSNEFFLKINKGLDGAGNDVDLSTSLITGLTGWFGTSTALSSLPLNTKVVLQAYDEDDTAPGLPLTDFVMKGVVTEAHANGILKIKITTLDGFPEQAEPNDTRRYVVDLFDETEKLFEFKFPRFSYRYKFEDGEYSTFAPFTQVAFSPGSFDYHPRKGYNIGMTNKLSKVELLNIITKDTPSDVVAVDILFKDDASPSIYVVDTIRPDDYSSVGNNLWDSMISSSLNPSLPQSSFVIEREVVSNIVPSNQLLRPWDNVPKKALAQDITGNRIVYANYTQNYDLISKGGKKYIPNFSVGVSNELLSVINLLDPSTNVTTSTFKSIKSLREYQLGVVFLDEYGRETPVLSNTTTTTRVEKKEAAQANRFDVQFNSDDYPQALTHFKFFVKETSSEYYNMAMDRWYSAGDGNIWLAFPSSDRNKIDIDTFLILKKGSDQDTLVTEAARYKVLAIENEAPDFIKTTKRKTFSKNHSTSTQQTNIFNTQDAPFVGVKSFKMNYPAFHGTSGQDIAITEDELWIEFSKLGTDEISARYKINSATNSWVDTTAPMSTTDVISIELDEQLGADVNFISDDSTGAAPSMIEAGATVNIYRYKTENLDRFDGRFFVKIYFDEVFRNNIETTTVGGGMRVTGSKKVYSMDSNLVAKHTSDLTRFLTRTRGETRSNIYTSWRPQDDNNQAHGQKQYGYYAVDEFSANALYFRRYREKEYTINGSASVNEDYGASQVAMLPNLGIGLIQPSQVVDVLNNTLDVRALVHLKKGGTSSGVNVDNSTHVGYKGLYWRDVPEWNEEFGYHANPTQTTKRAFGWIDQGSKGTTSMWQKAPGLPLSNESAYRENRFGYKSDEAAARDTEVWFIDAGPFEGTPNTSIAKLEWNSQNGAYPGSINLGIQNSTINNKWNMRLGFGGITSKDWDGVSDIDGFWNVGNWDTNLANSNPRYVDTLTTSFVRNINTGFQFRWKEDKDKDRMPYTIDGTVAGGNIMRHSDGPTLTPMIGPLVNNDDLSSFRSENSHQANGDLRSMAEGLSFNLTKNYKINSIKPALEWNPMDPGVIINGETLELDCVGEGGASGATATGPVCSGPSAMDLKVYVQGITVAVNNVNVTLHEGMALTSFDRAGGTYTPSSVTWCVREINKLPAGHFELLLGGYSQPLVQNDHNDLGGTGTNNNVGPPIIGGTLTFKQVGMNGYSDNSEFNINTISRKSGDNPYGAICAVGYTLEFVSEIQPTEVLSENPAIWETEPKESTELDIYYEASGAFPMVSNEDTISSAFPIGTKLWLLALNLRIFVVVGYSGDKIIVMNTEDPTLGPAASASLPIDGFFERVDGLNVRTPITSITPQGINKWGVTVDLNLVNKKFTLPWHNCYSFGNGVESNRIRDNFNLPYISNGVKASTTLEQEYKEEHRKYGLIYSGIYNSTSGVNNLNQFIAGEKITKDLNPIYGSIQKLHSRDSDLVVLCEDKILKVTADKDALYNADGKPQMIATNRVLGQTIPFSGEYGISTNPESFAAESYRAYFTDKARGAVMRLSKDGLTPISDHGMKDWFRDNLKLNNKLIGSYDDRNDEYNILLTNHNYFTATTKITGKLQKALPNQTSLILTTPSQRSLWFSESQWSKLSFSSDVGVGDTVTLINTLTNESLLPQNTTITSIENGIDVQYTGGFAQFYVRVNISNDIEGQTTGVTPTSFLQTGVVPNSDINGGFMDIPLLAGVTIQSATEPSLLSFSEKVGGWVSFKSFNSMQLAVSLANDYYTFHQGNLFLHYSDKEERNTFYGTFEPSSLEVVLNDNPGAVKVFNTLNYEGSQAFVEKFTYEPDMVIPLQPDTDYSDQEYYNLYEKKGWSVESIVTNKEEGSINEFLEKEGKWFNGINKLVDPRTSVDAGDFTFQGIGSVSDVVGVGVAGCTNSEAVNYNPLATIDDGSCAFSGPNISGCTDPDALNYDPLAMSDDGSCILPATCDGTSFLNVDSLGDLNWGITLGSYDAWRMTIIMPDGNDFLSKGVGASHPWAPYAGGTVDVTDGYYNQSINQFLHTFVVGHGATLPYTLTATFEWYDNATGVWGCEVERTAVVSAGIM